VLAARSQIIGLDAGRHVALTLLALALLGICRRRGTGMRLSHPEMSTDAVAGT
jgi:hypothetical protein